MHHQNGFQIGHWAGRADCVEVTLHELAIAATLGVLAPPDSRQMIPLERRTDRTNMLGSKAGEGHRQIKPHANLTIPMISEPIELFVGLFTPLPGENLEILKGWRINRGKPV